MNQRDGSGGARRLSAIHRFPVKSCRGHSLSRALVQPWGLDGDRRWMIVDSAGVFVTAREHPRMLLITPEFAEGGGLRLSAPDADTLAVDLPRPDPSLPVRVWRSDLVATPAGASADGWLSAVLGVSVRLVYLDDLTRRFANPAYAGEHTNVAFADGYPLLATTAASLDALNDLIAEGPNADEGPLPMLRFRPNIVVSGTQAWEEDGWRLLRVGALTLRAVKGCARCTITMTDPDTAARGKEPIATLARHRRWDGETWFGMNLVPVGAPAVISVGDPVEVLDSAPAPDGPLR